LSGLSIGKASQIPVVDLFAGIGGLGLGATASGGNVALSVELDGTASKSLQMNASQGHEVLTCDVTTMTGDQLRIAAGLKKREPLIVVGGAPCQPFSKAAYWTDEGSDSRYRQARSVGETAPRPSPILDPRPDARRTLVDEFWRLVSEANASGFVFENVPSIKHPRNKPTFDGLKAAAESAGYHVTEVLANAANYGVAQRRERIFLLGAKKRLPEPPKATHGEEVGQRAFVTAGDAIGDFSADTFFEPEEIVTGKWAKHLGEIPPGWNYKALTAWAGHSNPSFVAERRFWNFLLKLHPNKTSWTLAASPGPWTGPFHWESRRLRTVEMAALQGFPRGYKLAGSRRDRVRQIGNAVPPPMAKAMLEAVMDAVE
jgi:DNA (cytosine-5)-methyltransferase 1